MDDRTLRYYAEHDREIVEQYESAPSPLSRYFSLAFPGGGRILDLGCGSARDTAQLAAEGYVAYGVDPVEELRTLAVERHPELEGRIFGGGLPSSVPDSDILGGEFDGVVCSAVLQHVPRAELFDSAFGLRSLLRPNGRLLVSVPNGSSRLFGGDRDEHGRLFTDTSPAELQLLLERTGFTSIGRWTDADCLGRSSRTWTVLLFELGGAGLARPLDRIESVLRRDRKVATYKLALLRALCDVAATRVNAVEWQEDGRVALPIEWIADHWITYYWRFFENHTFVPQMSGEWKRQCRTVAFASPLGALVEQYARGGGLGQFLVDRKNGELAIETVGLLKDLTARLSRTIKEGPITHAGATQDEGPLFAFAGPNLLVDHGLWRELVLMGHWIRDSLLLRWAELCSRLSRNQVAVDQALGILLNEPGQDREVSDARRVYGELRTKRCVWSNRELRGSAFEVDHAIPFALWHNNDLWNLLPAARAVNNAKRDSLPTRALVHDRRGCIIEYWEKMRDAHPRRFEAEAHALCGREGDELSRLFAVFAECIEETALRRGCSRWEPS